MLEWLCKRFNYPTYWSGMSGITLLRGEEMKMQLKPHFFSFFHLYVIFFLLLVWAYVIHDFFESDKFEDIICERGLGWCYNLVIGSICRWFHS